MFHYFGNGKSFMTPATGLGRSFAHYGDNSEITVVRKLCTFSEHLDFGTGKDIYLK